MEDSSHSSSSNNDASVPFAAAAAMASPARAASSPSSAACQAEDASSASPAPSPIRPYYRRARGRLRIVEDAIAFGNRLHFVHLSVGSDDDDEEGTTTVPWPCLVFEQGIKQLLRVLQARDRLDCPRTLHRINLEYLRLACQCGIRAAAVTPVCFLFGPRTPGGNRLVFLPSGRVESDLLSDYRLYIATAVDHDVARHTEHASPFWEALQETSPILSDLLAEEMVTDPHRRLGPEEHAPAA